MTDASSLIDSSDSYLDFKNFRPFVLSDGANTKIVWERTTKTGSTATVMVAPLSAEGRIADKNDVESLNAFGNGRRPSLFLFHDKFFALWFDDRSGVDSVHLAENLGVQWVEVDSVQRRQNQREANGFPVAVRIPVSEGKSVLALVWQSQSAISLLSEDYHADLPTFSAKNFKIGRHGNTKNPSVRVEFPQDASGIQGFTSLWTFDPSENPEADSLGENFRAPDKNTLTAAVPEGISDDQKVFFKARVLDKAGNWSDVATLEYYYDITPPQKVAEVSLETDEHGFALSNDVSFAWQKDETDDDEIAGYSWTLTKIANLDKNLAVSKTKKLALSPEESQILLSDLTEKIFPRLVTNRRGERISSRKKLRSD